MTTAQVRPGAGPIRPFKAAQSYGPADGDLFHGRDAEGAALAKFMAEQTLAVLTAPTGMGKTSLLHAKVLPMLEAEGWLVVCARPGDDPLAALHAALASHLLPDLRQEADVIERVLEAASGSVNTLSEAQAWYSGLALSERVALRLFAPTADTFVALPMICRLLRGSIGILDFVEHLEAIVVDGAPLRLSPAADLGTLMARLRANESAALWKGWQDRVGGARSLGEGLRIFQEEWVPLRPGLRGVLLVVDQFEEVFTLLGRSVQEAFLRDLAIWGPGSGAPTGSRPVHLTLALRKEFFADLVPIVQSFGPIERLTFFLGPMPIEQARQSLSKPAGLFGLEFAPADDSAPVACVDSILALAVDDSEGRHVQESMAGAIDSTHQSMESMRFSPTLISLVGAFLWQKLELEEPRPEVLSAAHFKSLVPRVDDVFASFLGDALDQVDAAGARMEVDRFDALEMLDRLVTSSGFRNIIAESVLLEQTALARAQARSLLNVLAGQLKLVRIDSRHGERFIEITHERLIAPVRRQISEMRRRDVGRASLGAAFDMLNVLPDEADPVKDPLPAHFRDALLRFLPRLELDVLGSKNLMRSLLVSGPDGGSRDSNTRGRWRETFLSLCRSFSQADRLAPVPGERARLLAASELDLALDLVATPGQSGDRSDHLRHLALSALADRTSEAPRRIQQAFGAIARLGWQP